MAARPRVKPERTPTDRMLDATAIALVIIMWAMVVFSYSALPETIATHFNASGEADGYGSKATIFIMPAVGTATFILLMVLNQFPHAFNYPVIITEENANRHYALATRLIRMVNVCLIITFLVAAYSMQEGGTAGKFNAMSIVLPIVLGLPLLPIIWYFVQVRKIG